MSKYRNCFLLFLTAFVWGVAFVSQSKGMEYMKPFTFTASRNILAVIALMPVILYRRKKEDNKNVNWSATIIAGVLCGIALTAGSLFQQYGIVTTSVGKAGFITTLYIIFTPILGIFIGKKAPFIVWISAVIAAFGMYLLCMSESLSISRGDIMVFLCAVSFAVHILLIDYFSPKTDGVIISSIQFFVCFIICAVLAFVFDKPSIEQIKMGAVPILYAGFISSGVGYTLQIIGQKGVNPTVAAIILSLESVIASIAGVMAYKSGFLLSDQSLSLRQIIGCGVVFGAVILVQLPVGEKNKN